MNLNKHRVGHKERYRALRAFTQQSKSFTQTEGFPHRKQLRLDAAGSDGIQSNVPLIGILSFKKPLHANLFGSLMRIVQSLNTETNMLTDEYCVKILKRLAQDPEISQRALATELGVSLGKANYCLQALMEKGFVKVNNFKNSDNKKAYAYLLTQKGILEKARATTRFLDRKLMEYEHLQREIESLKREVQAR